MPTTVANLIDRILRDFLQPPDLQPARMKLDGAITNAQTTLTYDDSILSPEEAELIGPGSLLQIDSEEIVVGAINTSTNVLSDLTRGANNTTAAAHSDNAFIEITPLWRRKAIFDALGDSIVALWPDLYWIEDAAVTISSNTFTELPATTVEVYDAFVLSSGSSSNYVQAPYTYYDRFPASSTGKAIVFPTYYGSAGTVILKKKFTRPTLEANELDDLGIDDQWQRLLIISTVAYLINIRDIDDLTEEFIDAQLNSNSQQPGNSAQTLRDRLLTYERYLRDEAKRAQRYNEPMKMVQY